MSAPGMLRYSVTEPADIAIENINEDQNKEDNDQKFQAGEEVALR